MAKTSTKKGVQQLTDALIHHGITHIVFSLGSRNAPFVVAFANDKRFTRFVIPDERSAAFYALGMGEQLRQPVALMCTSGSAVLNYAPAISEAFYRNIPLIVVSADRPSEWIDQGDGQTIRQDGVLKNHVVSAVKVYENYRNPDEKWYNERSLNEILSRAKQPNGGPVHINFPFTEPLYEMEEGINESAAVPFQLLEVEKRLSSGQKTKLQEIWNASPKRMILCGQLPKNSYLNEQLKNLAKDKSVAVVVENTSNLQDRSFCHCIDRTINSFLGNEEGEELYRPDLLITIGGAVISKRIKKYLRKYKPKHHWKIGEAFPFMDTYQSLTTSIPLKPTSFFEPLLEEGFERNSSRFGEQWKQLDYLVQEEHFAFMNQVPYSDLSVFHFLLDAVPDQSALHIGNSSAIRYTQLFDPIKSISYYCNRGTSGIDGSMSTAIGNCMVGKQNVHTLIIGDMSFFYDSNALWNKYVPTNFRIFLINNGGGDIFNIIPGPQSTPNGDDYFVAKHEQSAAAICKAFDVNYYAAGKLEEIDQQLDIFYDVQENDRPALMEIFTSEENNSAILAKYFNQVKVKKAPILKR